MGKLLQERLHFIGTERAIETDHERTRMFDGIQERFHRLPAQCAPGAIRHCAGNDERNGASVFFKSFGDGKERCLCVQGIENRFQHQEIDVAFQQGIDPIAVTLADLVECDCPKSRVVYVRRKRGGNGQRAECASDEASFARLISNAISRFPGKPSRSQIHLVRGLS